MGKSSAVTTQELETLADTVSRVAANRSRLDRRRRDIWLAWRDDLMGRFHRMMKPAVRPYAGKVLVGVAASLLADLERAWRWADELDELTDELEGELTAERQQRAKLEHEQQETAKRMDALEHELAQVRANLARRPAATSLVLPAQKITVESSIQREILRLMAIEGLGRVWRIVERVLNSELTGTPNTARNAVNRLAERGLLADYEQHGKPVTWAYKAGGARRLVQLTPTGRQWCQAAFGQEPVESEIAAAARLHKSVSHGIAVLETAHHLAAAGYAVETEPVAILAAADEPWRARAEPDLAFTLSGEVWPTEVQREVSPRGRQVGQEPGVVRPAGAGALSRGGAAEAADDPVRGAALQAASGQSSALQHRGDGSRRLGLGGAHDAEVNAAGKAGIRPAVQRSCDERRQGSHGVEAVNGTLVCRSVLSMSGSHRR